MGVTHDKKEARKAIKTLRALETKLVGEERAKYLKALDLIGRYNVALRSRPVEVVQVTPQGDSQIDRLKAEINDLKNRIEQAKRQIETERKRPIDFGDSLVIDAFGDWATHPSHAEVVSRYLQLSCNNMARLLTLISGVECNVSEESTKRACAQVIRLCFRLARFHAPNNSESLDDLENRLKQSNLEFAKYSEEDI